MKWLANPKVRQGLVVNGLYFLYLFGGTEPARPRQDLAAAPDSVAARTATAYTPVSPPPPASDGTARAVVYHGEGTNQVEVHLTNDLTLVNRPDHTLLLSPFYTADADGRRPPDSVLLRFVSYSPRYFLSAESPVAITADGVRLWPESAGITYDRVNPRARYSDMVLREGRVIESVFEMVPYEIFVRLTHARRATVYLGPDVVQLTTEQLEALRDMDRHRP